MFTGIIEKTGKLTKIEKSKDKVHIVIAVNNFLSDIKIGSSIACDGVCLTVIQKNKDSFRVELMPETLKLTCFIQAREGSLINLEKALKIGDRLDGHFVTGHVDGVGKIKGLIKEGDYSSLIIKVNKKLGKYLANKGSVAVNGVSLTISGIGADWFKVSLITHTLNITNLGNLKVGVSVNIEVDMMARYVEKLQITD